jgi:uncharacterized membrane protein (UPF0127 family)
MKIFRDILIAGVVGVTLIFVYQEYRDDIWRVFVLEGTHYTVYVDDIALSVTVADSAAEFEKGLSGVASIPELGGKLFIFPDNQRHGIWMKDMEFSIDVLWFNSNLELIHIEEEVSPSSYPTIYASKQEARFVLEVNAYLVDSLQIQLGDRLLLPSSLLPSDIPISF